MSAVFDILAKSLIYKNKFTLGTKCCFLNCESINISGKPFIIFLELQRGTLKKVEKELHAV